MGVYQILNICNGKRYIGSSIHLPKRLAAHQAMLRCGKHDNPHLQHAWTCYGEAAFVFRVIECGVWHEDLLAVEQHFIDTLCPEYNVAPVAGSMSGYKHSPATRRKISEGLKGRTLSEEHCAAMSRVRMGHAVSDEARQKMSDAKKGFVISEDTKQKISRFHKGKALPPEHRRKISEANTGEGNYWAKLTEQGVREIKRLLQDTNLLQKEIAARFGIDPSGISDIKHGRRWGHVEMAPAFPESNQAGGATVA